MTIHEQDSTAKKDGEDVVTLNSRKNRKKNQQDEAGVDMGTHPPQKRRRRDERIASQTVWGDDEHGAVMGKVESEEIQKPTKKKQKQKMRTTKKQDSDDTAETDAGNLHNITKAVAKKQKKEKKKKKKKATGSRDGPQSPTKPKENRASDGILKEPRSSGKQLKRVSFSPKPETKSIPAVPYTRNKWLW